MGELLRSFTFDRNTLKGDAHQSAVEAESNIRAALAEPDREARDKRTNNIVSALRSYMGVLDPADKLSPVGEKFQRLFSQNPEDAWRWLLTRSLWLYVVPNGTNASVNRRLPAGTSFSFFRVIVGLLTHLSAQRGDHRFLYYEELCELLDDDDHWRLSPYELFDHLRANRKLGSTRILLGDLEEEYQIPRDNLNTVLNKAFKQTGLFEYRSTGGGSGRVAFNAIALATDLDPVLQRRVRFVIDHPARFDGAGFNEWAEFLQNPEDDLPEEVSFAEKPAVQLVEPATDLRTLVAEANSAFAQAGLHFADGLVHRFAAALLAKRFVILTGLSGSGKTKLAQAFAQWLAPRAAASLRDAFVPGQVLIGQGRTFTVQRRTDTTIEVIADADGKATILPIEVISLVAAALEQSEFDAPINATDLLAVIDPDQRFDEEFLRALMPQILAAALSFNASQQESAPSHHYEIVPVGADWSGRESILGYPDALTPDRYVRTTAAVDLILRAAACPDRPFFLVLDEMNLSHVEKYFSDFLSAMESDEKIQLHNSVANGGLLDGVPASLVLPANLFVIGTVNVDETTYMFSPKVLDRANCLEFRVERKQVTDFLAAPISTQLSTIHGIGAKFSVPFVGAAAQKFTTFRSPQRFQAEMILLFELLAAHGSEYGFRTAQAMGRFVEYYAALSPGEWRFEEAFDAQIYQKVLPKLHGSRRKLEPLLCSLAIFCWRQHRWDEEAAAATPDDPIAGIVNADELIDEVRRAASLEEDYLNPLNAGYPSQPGTDPGETEQSTACYPMSFSKIRRMLDRVTLDGFASFAEA